MRRILRALGVALSLAIAAPVVTGPAAAIDKGFQRDDLASDAVRLEKTLTDRAKGPLDAAKAKKDADTAFAKGDFVALETLAGRLVAATPKDWSAWNRYAIAAAAVPSSDYQVRWQMRNAAHAAAYSAYRLAPDARSQAVALTTLAQSYVASDDQHDALVVLRAALKVAEQPEARALYERLRPEWGFRLADYSVDSDAASPRACFPFTEDLKTSGVDYAPFVVVSGVAEPAITVETRQICVDGLEHGRRYGIVLRAGLPSAVGETLLKAADYDIYVRDRSPQVRFTGRNYVLPRTGQEGLPLVTVNTPSVDLTIHRIGDRSLVPTVRGDLFLQSLDGYRTRKLTEESGRLVWSGSMAVKGDLNQDTVTAFPVMDAVGRLEPGIYVMTAQLPGPRSVDENGDEPDSWEDRPTQWFIVSDLGLTAFSGDEGIDVLVRSLTDATPCADAEVRLIARNNDVLATAKTDRTGRATFAAGLTRGTGGTAPGVVAVTDGNGDYGFLDIAGAAFDLTDRGVAGRIAPHALDAMVVTERGVYRTGETVNVTALLRDVHGVAVPKVPLTLVAQRPDGVEYRRAAVADQGEGGRSWSLALLSGVQSGTWRIRAYADPKAPPVGEATFLVADYVPERIDLVVTPKTKVLAPRQPAEIDLAANHLYGAPGADLSIGGDVTLELAPSATVPGLAGWTTGLDDESFESVNKVFEDLGSTDEKGRAALTVDLPDATTTRPIQAKFDFAVNEKGGRIVERVVTVPLLPKGPVIAVKPRFAAGNLSAGSTAEFDVVSALPDGTRRAAPGLRWQLKAIETRHQWFKSEGHWDYQTITTTRRVADGSLDVGEGDPARLAVPVDWGRYRLDLASDDGLHTSLGFAVGWAGSDKADAPDVLDVALDETTHHGGDTLSVRLKPRFAGRATVAVVTDRIETLKEVAVDPAGTTVDLKVDPAWGAGAYVVAIAHRPLDVKARRQPGRALGVAWFAIEPEARRLSVAVATEEMIRPRGSLHIPVKVDGIGAGETARVVVAAVDEGILALTKYQTPNPEIWFHGQRRLALDLRDLYGQIIDGMQGTRGTITSGGDGGGDMSAPPPREAPFARYSGIVEVGPDGTAFVDFDVPAFNGTARVMVLAWTAGKVGHADRDVVIRDAVVMEPTAPRFLALGDRSRLHFALDNVDGPAGDYRVDLDLKGSLIVPAENLSTTVKLAQKGRAAFTVPVTAAGLGASSVEVRLAGPGIDATRTVFLNVVPPTREVYRRSVKPLAPGASVTLSDEVLADLLPGTGAVSVAVTPWSALDVPALLRALDRYPYGCTEQVVSRALPLLYVNRLAAESRLSLDATVDERIRNAIDRVLSRQDSTGSFGLWSASGEGDPWLDAYVADFLTRARETGRAVPQKALDLTLDKLRNTVTNATDPKDDDGPGLAYALYVLARNGRPVMGDLRYLSDQKIDVFATPIARAQLAAGLALLGDRSRAEPVFRAALADLSPDDRARVWRADYGSPLRDGAALMTLLAESGRPATDWTRAGQVVEAARAAHPEASTQEQAWMVLAASALRDRLADEKVTVADGGPDEATAGPLYRTWTAAALAGRPVTLTNAGAGDAKVVVTTSGNPIVEEPAAAHGYTVKRSFFTPGGQPIDLAKVKQTDRMVVVLEVSEPDARRARIVLTDPLPAGVEIADPNLVDGGDVAAFSWLKTLKPEMTEFLDDRFVAAFDRAPDQSAIFQVAYVVRAVTPGRYVQPPAVVEDMYQPDRWGRTGFGTLEVAPAK